LYKANNQTQTALTALPVSQVSVRTLLQRLLVHERTFWVPTLLKIFQMQTFRYWWSRNFKHCPNDRL